MILPTRVLVVDDDPDLAVQIRLLLGRTGRPYEVEGLDRPGDLAGHLAGRGCDAILLDHQLMYADGISVLRSLRGLPNPPPVVILTMSPDPSLPDAYLELGAADYLIKSEISPGLLDRTIRYSIAQWQGRRDLEQGQEALLRTERLATIGRIAAGVAHEYNNLNAVILAGVELLKRQVGTDAAAMRQLGRVSDSLERSRSISESLLLLGRGHGGDGIIDLRRRVADSAALLEPVALQAGVRLVTELPPQPCPVRFDAGEAHQVIVNLVINAIHAVHRLASPEVRLRLAARGDRAELVVEDHGVGIAAEDLSRIFEPFFSRKGAYDRDGRFPPGIESSGLGLSVCQSLVGRGGGRIAVDSAPDRGTTMTVILPLLAEAVPPAAGAVSGPFPAIASNRRERAIAIVDDNQDLTSVIATLLGDHGFAARTYADPAAFLADFPALALDAVLIDWRLPGMTGDRLLAALADPARAHPLPVVFLSGDQIQVPSAPPGTRVLGFLAKPFPVRRLVRMLDEVA